MTNLEWTRFGIPATPLVGFAGDVHDFAIVRLRREIEAAQVAAGPYGPENRR